MTFSALVTKEFEEIVTVGMMEAVGVRVTVPESISAPF